MRLLEEELPACLSREGGSDPHTSDKKLKAANNRALT